jgi:ribose transport system substrate-binding protein
MTKRIATLVIAAALMLTTFVGCSGTGNTKSGIQTTKANGTGVTAANGLSTAAKLDAYQPQKGKYYFVFTYKVIHPWWDAVKVGMNAAISQYEKKGITIQLDYNAPTTPDAIDQVNRLEDAFGKKPDVIGVDVCDIKIVTPTINKLVAAGQKVMTFSSSDATKADGCNRIMYVGNDHNMQDGIDLAEAMAKAINYKGEVAALCGTIGAPCHEDRVKGFDQVMAKYPNIKVVDKQYDNDDFETAVKLTENILQKHPNLKAIFCADMGNPVAAAQVVVAAGKKGKITIVGMDHDIRTLNYIKDGTILCSGVQDCYMMGFDSITNAVKIADGEVPGGQWIPKEIQGEKTTLIYKAQVQSIINLLYGGS